MISKQLTDVAELLGLANEVKLLGLLEHHRQRDEAFAYFFTALVERLENKLYPSPERKP